jgi:hypothetical protein
MERQTADTTRLLADADLRWGVMAQAIRAEEIEQIVEARREERWKALECLESADRSFYLLAKSNAITRVELALQLGIQRSSLYKRLGRIEKELQPRHCKCGCGWQLPRKSSRRRMHLNDTHARRAQRAQASSPGLRPRSIGVSASGGHISPSG